MPGLADAAATEIKKFGKHVAVTVGELAELVADFGQEATDKNIKRVNGRVGKTGEPYHDYAAAVRDFCERDIEYAKEKRKAAAEPPAPKPNRFINFNQRDIDFDQYEKLERLALQKKYSGDSDA